MPSAMGDEIVREIIHVIPSMRKTRFEFLCLAYLMGCVTAINLQPWNIFSEMGDQTKPIFWEDIEPLSPLL